MKGTVKKMKATGFIKKVDEMGRIVVPKDIRKALGISNLDYVQFYLDENGVVLRKYDNCCFLCSSREDVTEYKEKYICKKCIAEIKELK